MNMVGRSIATNTRIKEPLLRFNMLKRKSKENHFAILGKDQAQTAAGIVEIARQFFLKP